MVMVRSLLLLCGFHAESVRNVTEFPRMRIKMREVKEMETMNINYGYNYFQFQKRAGELGALLDVWKFEEYISPNDTVLDFGCGGGYLLSALKCKSKYGIEINPTAAFEAIRKDILVLDEINKMPKNLQFDVIISNHALEHVPNPLETIKELKNHLKDSGRIVVYVPLEDWRRKGQSFDRNDINRHLYAWTPKCIGNLFLTAGYDVKEVKIVNHAWIPFAGICNKILPSRIFNGVCNIWSIVHKLRQIRVVAQRK